MNGIFFIIMFSGLFFFLILSELLIELVLKKYYLDELKKHDMINAFITKNRKILFLMFPITMLMEELLFRYYLAILIFVYFGAIASILISSAFFALYHFHFLNLFKKTGLILVFVGYSFLLGIYLTYLLLNFGLMSCIILHFGIVYFTYYEIYRKQIKKKE